MRYIYVTKVGNLEFYYGNRMGFDIFLKEHDVKEWGVKDALSLEGGIKK